MNDAQPFQEAKSNQQLHGKSPNKSQGYALETIVLDELVQIDAEQLESDAQMRAEVEVLSHMDHIHLIVWIPLLQVLQDLHLANLLRPVYCNFTLGKFPAHSHEPRDEALPWLKLAATHRRSADSKSDCTKYFNQRLLVESLLIPDNFRSNVVSRPMIERLRDLPERSLSKGAQNFVP